MTGPEPDTIDEPAAGFDTRRHKLLCLIALDDDIASAFSSKAGTAFFRAFIVQERATGDVYMNQRFRYNDGDSWCRIGLSPERQKLSRAERVAFLQEGIERVLQTGLGMLAEAPPPAGVVHSFFPPDPDGDPQNTLQWLIQQDLVEIQKIERIKGTK